MRTHKMTSEDFIKAFNKAGFDFNAYGWEGILNLVALNEYYTTDNYYVGGFTRLAEQAQDRASIIYNILQEVGYYESEV